MALAQMGVMRGFNGVPSQGLPHIGTIAGTLQHRNQSAPETEAVKNMTQGSSGMAARLRQTPALGIEINV